MISEETQPEEPTKRFSLSKFLFLLVVAVVTLCFGLVWTLANLNQSSLTSDNPVTITIQEGDSVRDIATNLESAGVVNSSELLYFFLATQFDATQIKASRYIFDEPLTTYEVAQRLIDGDFDTNLVSVTIFEGESRAKIAERLDSELSWFEADAFMSLSAGMEGFLFPDTYFLPENFTTVAFVDLLHDAYHDVVDAYMESISTSSLTETEVIILASIVEREANSENSMKTVAGIFLNRLEIGMALQADASIEYVLEQNLNELPPGALAENLRELDTPYNTYLYPGLPPTPIGNPGLTAIQAVLSPIPSDYYYYITGNDGNFYYAETYNQHLNNIERYLR